MDFFYKEDGCLWKDLIGKKNNSKIAIEMELNNLETLRLFSWLEQDINKYKMILRNILEDINEKNRKKTEQHKLIQKEIKELEKDYIKKITNFILAHF